MIMLLIFNALAKNERASIKNTLAMSSFSICVGVGGRGSPQKQALLACTKSTYGQKI